MTYRGALLAAMLAAVVTGGPTVATALADTPGPHQAFAITREGDARLKDHTVFRPTNLDAPAFKLPIVVWGNGGCRESNEEFRFFLMKMASYGYLMIANGAPENPYRPEELSGIARPTPQKLIDAIDWAIAENGRPGSRFHDRLDPSRIAVMGQSCGAWEAIDASADKRVDSTIAWNNGGDPHAGDITKVHAPILFASGGDGDFTFAETVTAYERVPAGVPAVRAEHADAEHTNFWDPPEPGGHSPIMDEPPVVAQQWLSLTLYGSPAGRKFFVGDGCGLCTRDRWTVRSKNWERFALAASQAPARERRATSPSPPPAPGSSPARTPSRQCSSRRRFFIHVRARGQLRRARRGTLRVGTRSRRVALRRVGDRLRAVVDLRGRAAGTVRVELTVRVGRRGVQTIRTYDLCAPR